MIPMSNLNQIHQLLGEVNAKCDTLLESRLDQEGRLRKLERWASWVTGIGTAVTALFGWLMSRLS